MKTILEILPGEKAHFEEDVLIEGNIGAGAILEVNEGSLVVKGQVAADVKITVKKPQSATNRSFTGCSASSVFDASMKIRNRHQRLIINTKGFLILEDDNFFALSNMANRVTLCGEVGDNVQLTSDGQILAKSFGNNCVITSENMGIFAENIGKRALLYASEMIEANQVESDSMITSKFNEIRVKEVKNFVTIKARKSVELGCVGDNCQITSEKYSIDVKNQVGADCLLTARDDISFGHIGNDTIIRADGDIIFTGAHPNPNSLILKCRWDNEAPAVQASSSNATTTVEAVEGPLIAKIGLFAAKASEWSNLKIPKAFECPLTHEYMVDPVLLSIDCRTYERADITAWLQQHRNSPFTREAMGEQETIAQVLIPNRTIADAIAEFKQNYPGVFNKAQASVNPR